MRMNKKDFTESLCSEYRDLVDTTNNVELVRGLIQRSIWYGQVPTNRDMVVFIIAIICSVYINSWWFGSYLNNASIIKWFHIANTVMVACGTNGITFYLGQRAFRKI